MGKLVEYAGLVLFALLTPNLMGPELYGRFAAVMALVSLLMTACSLGGLATFGRFLPELRARGEWTNVRVLFVQFFWTRAAVAVVLAAASTLFLPLLLLDTPWTTVASAAGALVVGVAATTCYQVFYGLNRLSKSTFQDALTRIVLLALLVVLGGSQSLDSAVRAFFITQLLFLLLGLYWTRSLFTRDRAAFDSTILLSHLRFGLTFFVGQLLLVATWRSGEILVLLFSGKSEEVAYFSVANAAIMALTLLTIQVSMMFVPSLTALHVTGEGEQLDHITSFYLKYLTIASFCGLFVVYALADWAVEAIMGARYLPIADNLRVLALGLPLAAVLGAGISRAVVYKQPGKIIWVSGTGLATVVVASAACVPSAGSLGASSAMVLAMLGASLMASYQLPLLRAMAGARLVQLMPFGFLALAVTAPFVASNVLAGSLAMLAFITLLFGSRIVKLREIRQIAQEMGLLGAV